MPQDQMQSAILVLFILFFSIGIHEYVHAKVADMAGDPTPSIYGRVTLNLTKHFDPIGVIFIIITVFAGYGLGWGKPVPMNPSKMRNPRWDHFWAVFCAPLTNLAIAIFAGLLFRIIAMQGSLQFNGVQEFLYMTVIVNLGLFFFNMLPLGPLDGMWIFGSFLPEKQRHYWTKFNLSIGSYFFLALVLIRIPTDRGWVAPLQYLMPFREPVARLLLGY